MLIDENCGRRDVDIKVPKDYTRGPLRYDPDKPGGGCNYEQPHLASDIQKWNFDRVCVKEEAISRDVADIQDAATAKHGEPHVMRALRETATTMNRQIQPIREQLAKVAMLQHVSTKSGLG